MFSGRYTGLGESQAVQIHSHFSKNTFSPKWNFQNGDKKKYPVIRNAKLFCKSEKNSKKQLNRQ